MRYPLRHILERRFDPNRSEARKISERYVILNFLLKLVSAYPSWLFLNLGIHPDWVTLASLGFIVGGAASFILGYPVLGVVLILVFILLDSVDGDMARAKGPTVYGGTLDSFGADFFYALVPVSVGFFLMEEGIAVGGLSPERVFLAAVLVSLSFMLYRMVNMKVLRFTESRSRVSAEGHVGSPVAETRAKFPFLSFLFGLYRHEIVKGNFFAEPGMVFWFSVLTVSQAYAALAWYLLAILAYNAVILGLQMTKALIAFRSFSPSR